MQVGTRRERDPKVRQAALRRYGFVCMICGLNPSAVYGSLAKECLDVHHLKPLSGAEPIGVQTAIRDVIVLCPTCHRALHISGMPEA